MFMAASLIRALRTWSTDDPHHGSEAPSAAGHRRVVGLPDGHSNPTFRTKPQPATPLIEQARAAGVSFRAVVADCFYGDHAAFTGELWAAGLPFVPALKPSQGSWAPVQAVHTPVEAAREPAWGGPMHCGPSGPG
ncbi:hypothetical protein GCM10009525_23850 [Streptosporangium amethystogenes subsp. fukuiense]